MIRELLQRCRQPLSTYFKQQHQHFGFITTVASDDATPAAIALSFHQHRRFRRSVAAGSESGSGSSNGEKQRRDSNMDDNDHWAALEQYLQQFANATVRALALFPSFFPPLSSPYCFLFVFSFAGLTCFFYYIQFNEEYHMGVQLCEEFSLKFSAISSSLNKYQQTNDSKKSSVQHSAATNRQKISKLQLQNTVYVHALHVLAPPVSPLLPPFLSFPLALYVQDVFFKTGNL